MMVVAASEIPGSLVAATTVIKLVSCVSNLVKQSTVSSPLRTGCNNSVPPNCILLELTVVSDESIFTLFPLRWIFFTEVNKILSSFEENNNLPEDSIIWSLLYSEGEVGGLLLKLFTLNSGVLISIFWVEVK